MGKRGDRSCPLPTSRDYRALTAKQNCLEKASGPCGPRKIRARTKAREWRARACGGVPSCACARRILPPRGRERARGQHAGPLSSRLRGLSEVGVRPQSRLFRIGS